MRRSSAAWLLVVIGAHAAIYGRALTAGFMTDDFLWLEAAGREVSVLEHAASREPFGYLRPLFHLLMAGSRACFGLDATALHALALGCSVATASLLFALTREAARSDLAAGVAALWLTTHPAQGIAISWASSLPSLLALTFGLGALWCWQAWLRRGGVILAGGALLAHALALASKEEAVMVSVAMFAWSVFAPSRRGRALLWLGHAALTSSFVCLWLTTGAAAAAYAPSGVEWLFAAAEPLARARALWLPRHVVTAPYAEVLLFVLALQWWRRGPGARGPWCAGVVVALASLLPSSVGLWGFPWDKLDRLLLPAVPAAGFVVGLWVASARPRRASVCVVAALLALFAARSHKIVARRVEDAARVEGLVAALAEAGPSLSRAASRGESVAIRGYEVTWSAERAWIYPSGPARAMAPGVRLVHPERADVVLDWDPERGRFEVSRPSRSPR